MRPITDDEFNATVAKVRGTVTEVRMCDTSIRDALLLIAELLYAHLKLAKVR